jgi:hypothetical protein
LQRRQSDIAVLLASFMQLVLSSKEPMAHIESAFLTDLAHDRIGERNLVLVHAHRD